MIGRGRSGGLTNAQQRSVASLVSGAGVGVGVTRGTDAYRWSELIAKGPVVGVFTVLDVGVPMSVWYSDGAIMQPLSGNILLHQSSLVSIGMTGAGAASSSDIGAGVSGGGARFRLGSSVDLMPTILGRHGTLRVTARFSNTASGNSHGIGVGLGDKFAVTGIVAEEASANWITKTLECEFSARGSHTSQYCWWQTIDNAGVTRQGVSATTFDLSRRQALWAFGNLLNQAADTIMLESWRVELFRKA